MKALSLCSGAGGWDLGFTRAGIDIVAHCEIDPVARSVLRRHWPDTPCHEDIRTLDGTQYRGIDIVFGGTPCQDLSVAGKRGGLAGERSGLWHEMVRIIDEAKPRFAVWENVPGALSSNGGRDFAVILDSLAEVGALDISYRVLDAQFFGVAQRRRRVFLVADFGGERASEILLEPGSGSRNTPPSRTPGQDVAGTLGGGSGSRGWSPDTDRMTFVPDVSYTLRAGRHTADTAGLPGNDIAGQFTVVAKPLAAHKGGWSPDTDRMTFVPAVASVVRTREGAVASVCDGTDNLMVQSVAPVDFVNVTSAANRTRVEYGSPANTLHSAGQSIIGPAIGVRRLTPVECERLMGWPDGWTAGHADSHRYKMIGNGVVASVAEWIGRRMLATA